MTTSTPDHLFMRRALDQAERARLISPPNPAVGCVLVAPDGRVIGEGHTQPVGQAHGEIMALRSATAAGHSTQRATAYVTLEPCSHHGRTGPCCDALIAAGVGRVVVSMQDPNPRVSGQGIERLRAAGVTVDVGLGAEAARALNLGFFSRMVRGTPWVRMKAASSLDGRTALPNGASQWITSPEARTDGHAWRARACAVLTGIGTVLEDDPALNVRLVDTPRQPALVIVDSRLQTPLDARLWSVPDRRVVIFTANPDIACHQPYLDRGADVRVAANASGKVDLAAMLRALAGKEVNEVLIEAGHKLNGSLLRERLVDELLLYQAPLLLGEGAGIAGLGPFESLGEGVRLSLTDLRRVGPDLRLRATVEGRDQF